MAVHSFDLGELVTVFQMSPAKGLMIEGRAWIVNLDDADEYYEVRFRSDIPNYDSVDDCPTYQRFIDREGQEDPDAYRREFNKRIGKAA
jgi:hypothetical protein